MSFRDGLISFAYRAGWELTKLVPTRAAQRIFDAIADVASSSGQGPEQLRKNLARVVGPENVTKQLVRDSMRSYMRYWQEAFRLPSMVGDELAEKLDHDFDSESKKNLADSVSAGKGVVITLPHSGNWDMSGVWLVHTHGQFSTVAERLKPESLFDAFLRFRESLGFHVIPLTGGAEPPMEVLENVLNDGGIVCLMGERDLTGRGIPVDFFGERAYFPAGPAKLAQKTGAAFHTAATFFKPEQFPGDQSWGLRLSKQIDTQRPLNDVVQTVADDFADHITANPQDWHMLQPIFHNDLSLRRKKIMGVDDTSESAES